MHAILWAHLCNQRAMLDFVGRADCNLAGVHPLHPLTFQRDQKQNIMKKLFCGELSCFQFRMPDSESQFQNCRFHHRWPSWLSGWSSEHQRRRSVDQTLTSPIFIKLFCTSKPTLVFLVVWLSYTGLHETYTCRTRVLFREVWLPLRIFLKRASTQLMSRTIKKPWQLLRCHCASS